VAAVVRELASETTVPPVGAADGSVTVPVELAPLTSELGDSVRLATGGGGGLTVRVPVCDVPWYVAVIVTVCCEATERVVTGNVPFVKPPGTVIVAGTVAAAVFELVRETTPPAVGAMPFSVTVPVEGVPPTSADGVSTTVDTSAGLTVIVTVFGVPVVDAVSVTFVEAATPLV
jgi:hypothetical protein